MDAEVLKLTGTGWEVQRLPVSSLKAGDTPRLNGESAEHIRLLAASEAPLPPILVHRGTLRVIDGMHRLRAAQLRGQDTIEVKFFDGSQEDAFIGAVRANTEHGLPLTLADREAAAARIVRSHPQCSDRWIASVTGLSAGTVASIRRNAADDRGVAARIGRDGRIRPLRAEAGRRRACDAINQNPGATLREIAKIAGVSPSTAWDVRERMRRGDDPVPPRQPNGQRRPPPKRSATPAGNGQPMGSQHRLRSPGTLLENLRRDPSLRFSDAGRGMLRWLDTRVRGPAGWEGLIGTVPPHCAYLIAELARSCAQEWLNVAVQIEQRMDETPDSSRISRHALREGQADVSPLRR